MGPPEGPTRPSKKQVAGRRKPQARRPRTQHLDNVGGSCQIPAIKPWISWIRFERADDDDLRLVSYPVLFDAVEVKRTRPSEQKQQAQCP